MKVNNFNIDKLKYDPKNVRIHDPVNINAIKKSLKKYGQQKPIVIDADGFVIAGNGTLEAARQLGWDEIVCVVSDLKNNDKIGYALADNRTSELANWDNENLIETLKKLKDDGYEIDVLEFNDIDLEFKPKLPDEEEINGLKKIQLIVECKNKEELENLFNELKERDYKVKVKV